MSPEVRIKKLSVFEKLSAIADNKLKTLHATAEALTTYGILGVKVWIFKGEILGEREAPQQSASNA